MLRQKPPILRRPRVPVEGLFCNYSHRTCMNNRLDGSEYCIKHVLEDKNSSYKQCNFMVSRNGKRCPNAASKTDKKEGYCQLHAQRSLAKRHKNARKKRPTETPETLLESVEQHSSRHRELVRDGKRLRLAPDSTSRILEYASSSDSDSEPMLVDQAWRGDGDSDAESVDSEQEDPLKHAAVYTAEEVALITRDKLIRLQSLYIDQFKRLQHIMKEKRRKYLHTVKQERATLGSVKAAKDSSDQRDSYDRLVAMKRYHKRYGKEALLQRQSKERRIAVSEGPNYKPPSYPKCTHMDNGIRCAARTVPLSKFCQDHILFDVHQVLYRTCGFGNGICNRPIPKLSGPKRCAFHAEVAEFRDRLAKEEEKPQLVQVKEEGREIPTSSDVMETPNIRPLSIHLAGSAALGTRPNLNGTVPLVPDHPDLQNDLEVVTNEGAELPVSGPASTIPEGDIKQEAPEEVQATAPPPQRAQQGSMIMESSSHQPTEHNKTRELTEPETQGQSSQGQGSQGQSSQGQSSHVQTDMQDTRSDVVPVPTPTRLKREPGEQVTSREPEVQPEEQKESIAPPSTQDETTPATSGTKQ